VGSRIRVFILAKDEAANISRCLDSITSTGWPVTVLDSGSSDGTREICAARAGVRVAEYKYSDHVSAYNEITTSLVGIGEYALILDADMRISPRLASELEEAAAASEEAVLLAPVEMWWAGMPLKHGSLYPLKAVLFPGGKAYFQPSGHGERLIPGVRRRELGGRLTHDDRKPYGAYLSAQARYGSRLSERALRGEVSMRDRIRVLTPLLIVLSPLYSWVVRLGCLSGRLGYVYALDRLIAEAVQHRQAVAVKLGGGRLTGPGSELGGGDAMGGQQTRPGQCA